MPILLSPPVRQVCRKVASIPQLSATTSGSGRGADATAMESPAYSGSAGFPGTFSVPHPGPTRGADKMGSVNNVGGNSPLHNVQKIYTRPVARPAAGSPAQGAAPARGADKAELSGVGHFLQALKAGGDVRADKVAALKA